MIKELNTGLFESGLNFVQRGRRAAKIALDSLHAADRSDGHARFLGKNFLFPPDQGARGAELAIER